MHIYLEKVYICVCVDVGVYMYMYKFMYIYTHIPIYTYIHVYTKLNFVGNLLFLLIIDVFTSFFEIEKFMEGGHLKGMSLFEKKNPKYRTFKEHVRILPIFER